MAKKIVQAEKFSVSEYCTQILKIHQLRWPLNWGPNQSPKTFPAILGKVRVHGPGSSQWAQAMRVKSWSYGPPGILPYGLFLALGGSSNPHRPWTIGKAKDPKRPLITNPSVMAKTQIKRTMGTSPLLG
ncbi:hypothetical protein O181_053892 [Austropuccinia psidii MF-1]|uniref:Uncharacterized protein n=1 Tax=Austropuccinia psidii MF-1 TaxID=1389203 RepID=A0A9Q3E5S3_9BASI|nr:hypothetical protein [Austropuccinia psidii MF-1]